MVGADGRPARRVVVFPKRVLTGRWGRLTIRVMATARQPAPLSAAIVCCDNERTIGRTLSSVRGLARQIVAVDSGSTDGTLDLLRDAGAQIIEHDWLGYGAQKNLALDRCVEPWTLFLDSDESVEPALADAISRALRQTDDDSPVAGYCVNRMVHWAGRPLRHAWRPEWRLRLVRTGAFRWSADRVHESLDPVAGSRSGRIERLAGDLRHDTIPSVAEHLARQVHYAKLGADDCARRGRSGRISSLLFSPAGAWLKQMVVRQAWRDGWRGWSAASISACATLMKHLALLEMTRLNTAEPGRERDDE